MRLGQIGFSSRKRNIGRFVILGPDHFFELFIEVFLVNRAHAWPELNSENDDGGDLLHIGVRTMCS